MIEMLISSEYQVTPVSCKEEESMPTIYETNESGEHFRYVHHSLVAFYLEQASNNALQAKEEQVEGVMLSSSMVSILFSAIALEAALNEFAEKVLDESELEDFEFCRQAFRKKRSRSALRCKLNSVIQRKFDTELPDTIGVEIDHLSRLRNALVHYKLSKYATKLKVNTPKTPAGLTVVDFTAPTEVIDEPLVRKITADAAVAAYNGVLRAINYWGELEVGENNTPGFEVID
jgi:hypothetical protein